MFENIRSKVVVKIGLLIIIETMFIISSFGTLAYFQSEGSSLGNSINIAGKNRYLTGNVLFEAEKYLESLSTTDLSRLRAAMDNLESNISVLKQGGKISGIELESLSSEFSNLWNTINREWKSYKEFINNNIIIPSEVARQQPIETQLESMASGLIDSSDTLVTRLGNYAAINSNNLMVLEVVLAVINIGILVLILYLVIKILRPINGLTRATSEVKKGNFNISVNGKGERRTCNSKRIFQFDGKFNKKLCKMANRVKK